MKYFCSLLALAALLSFRSVEDIYSLALKNIDGGKVDLHQYRGKKMLFIVLPLTSQDTTVPISELSQLQAKYQQSLTVIGIPAEETGFKKEDENKFKKLYKDAAANVMITEGMKVKKGSGQSSLFQWLTSKGKNQHFDQDVQGVGSKFFVDEAGELYAVMGAELKLSHPLMERILSRPQGKKEQ